MFAFVMALQVTDLSRRFVVGAATLISMLDMDVLKMFLRRLAVVKDPCLDLQSGHLQPGQDACTAAI